MVQLAYITDSLQLGDRRRAVRRAVHFAVEAPVGDNVAPLTVLDLSESGMRIATGCDLAVGEAISLCLPRSTEIVGHVRWREGDEYGVLFQDRIPVSVVTATRLASRPAERGEGAAPGSDVRNEAGALRDRDLLWIAPAAGAVRVWFALVDAGFALAEAPARIAARLRRASGTTRSEI